MIAWSDRCRWIESESTEKQSDDQREKMICPRCGDQTLKETSWAIEVENV